MYAHIFTYYHIKNIFYRGKPEYATVRELRTNREIFAVDYRKLRAFIYVELSVCVFVRCLWCVGAFIAY